MVGGLLTVSDVILSHAITNALPFLFSGWIEAVVCFGCGFKTVTMVFSLVLHGSQSHAYSLTDTIGTAVLLFNAIA